MHITPEDVSAVADETGATYEEVQDAAKLLQDALDRRPLLAGALSLDTMACFNCRRYRFFGVWFKLIYIMSCLYCRIRGRV